MEAGQVLRVVNLVLKISFRVTFAFVKDELKGITHILCAD